jgi:hypothetical protein
MRSSFQVAAAVAAVLGASSGVALAAPPGAAAAAAAPIKLYLAGSSAARSALIGALQVNLCSGAANATTFASTGNGNFFAISCNASTTNLPSFGGALTTVYYRVEGGSVVGALPLVSNAAIFTLNLADAGLVAACPAGTAACAPAVTGTSGTNGISDTFTGAVVKHVVELGITDVEPAVLVGDNYPSAYLPSAFGTASTSQMAALSANAVPLFDQVFGIFVNTNSAVFSASEKNTSTVPGVLNLSKAVITNLLQGNSGDWSTVPDTSGNAVASSSLGVTIDNREAGSGTRTGASIYFTGDECSPTATSISDPAGATNDSFSTGDVLNKANATPGAITYASIDNFSLTGHPNLVLVNVNGITPTNLAAATGQYDFWFEATAIKNPHVTFTSNQNTLVSFIETAVQTEATAPHAVDVLVIPGQSTNNASLPVSGTANGSPAIYVNPMTRATVSCNTPISAL